jgi:hypothetical protein
MEVGIFSFPEDGFVIDSKLKNIKEIGNDNLITGKVFTDFLVKGDFFKIPADEEKTIYKITSKNGYIY